MLTVIKNYLQSLFLWELIKGLQLTGRHLFSSKVTVAIPRGKDPPVTSLSRPACLEALSER
jgi:Formate hydrogenlyase subunit 6/NADH:ubiquinone oxidoreductase 23 kD subunit (chain I)